MFSVDMHIIFLFCTCIDQQNAERCATFTACHLNTPRIYLTVAATPAEKIQLILDWACFQQKRGSAIGRSFNTEYVEMLYHALDRNKMLEARDIKNLDKIISGFHILAWQQKPCYKLWAGKANPGPASIGFAFVSDDDD